MRSAAVPLGSLAVCSSRAPVRSVLAAMFAVQRGHEVHVLDIVEEGPKPALVRDLGAKYHSGPVADACPSADIVVECTGVARLVFDVLGCTGPAGIVCLTGVSSSGRHLRVDAGAINRDIVLENDVVFGTVNANAAHYRAAVDALAAFDTDWLRRIVTRAVPLDDWASAFERREGDVKTVIDIGGSLPPETERGASALAEQDRGHAQHERDP